MNRILAPLGLAALAVVALSCAGPERRAGEPVPPPDDAPIQLTLLGINDLHGALLDRPIGRPVDDPLRGGAAMLSAWVAAVRAENPGGVLLVDAGDMLQGPLLVNRFEGLPVADLYDHVGVAAAALGNHEFDYGPLGEGEATVVDGPFGALNAYLDRASFLPLSANLASAGGPLPRGVLPHAIVLRKGVRIGLIGLTTPTTPGMSRASNIAGVAFGPLGPAVASSVEALQADGAEAIVVLGHLDGGCRSDRAFPPPETCLPDGELVEVLEAGGGAIDAVVLGHRHFVYANLVDGVAIVEAGSRGRGLSRVDLRFDPAIRRVDRSATVVSDPIPLCEATPAVGASCFDPDAQGPWTPVTHRGAVVAPDPAIGPLLAPYLAEVEAICAEPLATASVPLSRSRGAESALGNLVADAMRAWGEADVAIINSGSLRADLAAGPVSYCDVYGLFPFDSRFVVLEVTGAELERILEFLSSGAHSMPQVSGLRLAVHAGDGAARDLDGDGAMADWERDRLVRFTDEAGQPLDAEASYRFVATDYIVGRPGDAEFVFGQIPAERTTASDDRIREAIAEHLGTVATPLGTDGGWPLPDPDDPRVRYEGAEAP